MQLFGLIVSGVHPRQLITVSDSRAYLEPRLAHLKAAIPDRAQHLAIEPVTSFFPGGMCDADSAWLAAYAQFKES